jgi:hypothetical protein
MLGAALEPQSSHPCRCECQVPQLPLPQFRRPLSSCCFAKILRLSYNPKWVRETYCICAAAAWDDSEPIFATVHYRLSCEPYLEPPGGFEHGGTPLLSPPFRVTSASCPTCQLRFNMCCRHQQSVSSLPVHIIHHSVPSSTPFFTAGIPGIEVT